MTISGTIVNAAPERDGDYHVRVDVDDKSLLNERNISAQNGYLVVEPLCENPVTQADTLDEGVCADFHQNIFDLSMVGMRVTIVGAYVEDMEHGWREIHPVTSITPIP